MTHTIDDALIAEPARVTCEELVPEGVDAHHEIYLTEEASKVNRDMSHKVAHVPVDIDPEIPF